MESQGPYMLKIKHLKTSKISFFFGPWKENNSFSASVYPMFSCEFNLCCLSNSRSILSGYLSYDMCFFIERLLNIYNFPAMCYRQKQLSENFEDNFMVPLCQDGIKLRHSLSNLLQVTQIASKRPNYLDISNTTSCALQSSI